MFTVKNGGGGGAKHGGVGQVDLSYNTNTCFTFFLLLQKQLPVNMFLASDIQIRFPYFRINEQNKYLLSHLSMAHSIIMQKSDNLKYIL